MSMNPYAPIVHIISDWTNDDLPPLCGAADGDRTDYYDCATCYECRAIAKAARPGGPPDPGLWSVPPGIAVRDRGPAMTTGIDVAQEIAGLCAVWDEEDDSNVLWQRASENDWSFAEFLAAGLTTLEISRAEAADLFLSFRAHLMGRFFDHRAGRPSLQSS